MDGGHSRGVRALFGRLLVVLLHARRATRASRARGDDHYADRCSGRGEKSGIAARGMYRAVLAFRRYRLDFSVSVAVHRPLKNVEECWGIMTTEAHVQHPNYVRIWAILVALLLVSVVGSMSHIRDVVLIAAFGVALVKAYLVAKNFMHVNVEKRWVPYLLIMCLLFIAILFAGVSPDVMKHAGLNWNKNPVNQPADPGAAAKHE